MPLTSRTGEGWLNLAGHKDLLTGEIVGHADPYFGRYPFCGQGLTHQSDHGSPYGAYAYRALRKQ